MSEMVEVAALAIAAEHAEMEPDDPYRFRRLAKAAIRALRKPTLNMILAGLAAEAEPQEIVQKQWEAMIDAALQPDIETF